MTEEAQQRVLVSFIVTDLVKSGAIGKQISENDWVVGNSVAGISDTEHFPTRELLIGRVVDAYTTWLRRLGTLRAAG